MRDAIAPCFADAISRLKEHPSLCKEFIRFIPSDPGFRDKFFAPVRKRILAQVKGMPIIRTSSGGWIDPSHALMVPNSLVFEQKTFVYGNGVVLWDHENIQIRRP